MKKLLLSLLPTSFAARLREYRALRFNSYANESYSQEGEDLILRRVFEGKRSGFYVDVGAHHPMRFSNTYLFYKLGWNGVNIDAMPGSMQAFRRWRPRDINIEAAIAKEEGELTYSIFNDRALNSFDLQLSNTRNQGPYRIVRQEVMKTRRLDQILFESFPAGTKVDFLTIDVEGLDLEVLESNDWEWFRPTYVLVECWGATLEGLEENAIAKYLSGHDYAFFAKTVATLIYRSSREQDESVR